MNDETYTPCTKCGRPMKICKGQCCGQPQGCGCREYGPMKAGCLREIEPSCPYQAVIPTLTVEDKSNLKDLADCFVHVSNINTTFYIDDKHRTIVTWAGPVEYENYDLDANTLGLRSQFLIDKANEYAAYYDKTGAYQLFNYSEGGESDTPIRLRMEWPTGDGYWRSVGRAPYGGRNGAVLRYDFIGSSFQGSLKVSTYDITNDVSFINEDTSEELDLEDVYTMLTSGAKIILDNVPLGADVSYDANGDAVSAYASAGTDEIVLSGPSRSKKDSEGEVFSFTTYSGTTLPIPAQAGALVPLGIIIGESDAPGDDSDEIGIFCWVQGISYNVGSV